MIQLDYRGRRRAAVRASLRSLAAVLCLFVAAGNAAADTDAEQSDDLLHAALIAESGAVQAGQPIWVALRQQIAPGWHTYWRNPGEGGQATTLRWELPPGWKADAPVWPAPARYRMGPFTNFVYSGEVLLPVRLEAPADAKAGDTATLRAHATFLLCRDICIPQRADLDLKIGIAVAAPGPDAANGAAIREAVEKVARRPKVSATYSMADGRLTLALPGAALSGESYFYPDAPGAIDPNASEDASAAKEGLVMHAEAVKEFDGRRAIRGVLVLADAREYEVEATPGALPAWAARPEPAAGPPTSGAFGTDLWSAALLAFLGGLILNLMPCVFPILSMKAAALVGHGGDAAQARREALAFLAGSLAAFLILAGFLVAARAAGEHVGWGFQLQSPLVVALLALVMLLAGLNLSGVFEAGLVLQRVRVPAHSGLAGAFVTGALAAVVAAPCTAPMMGPAIGWSLTQAPAIALLVFAALGGGLAMPFVVLSYVPRFTRLLPRPGPWLDRLRKALAFPMYAAALWLAWVLALQTGGTGLPGLFGAALAIAVAAWAWGIAQHGGSAVRWRVTAAIAALVFAPLGVEAARSARPLSSQRETGEALAAERWSPERVAELQAQGRPVFVDFTAAWCITCQVNERIALSTAEVAAAFRRANAAYLRADWTAPDAAITQALAAQGRSGVPLYLLYSGSAAPRVLPQILTPATVVAALDAAHERRSSDALPQSEQQAQ